MSLSQEHLEAIRAVCRALSVPDLVYDPASGTLEGAAPLSSELFAALDLLIRDQILDDAQQIDGEIKGWPEVSSSALGEIRIALPVTVWANGSHVVYRNLEALIGRGLFLTRAPAACYLIDEDVLLPQDQLPSPVDGYLRAVELAELLSEQADHQDKSGRTPQLIFLHKASLTLPISYHARDLIEPAKGLELLQELLRSAEHKEQKKSILKAVLYDRLNGTDPGQRFRRMLRNLSEFEREFRERYHLFVCEFDFEEVRKELEEKRRDYLVRLNAAFHDMGAKLLSIPVALYLALTEMQPLPAGGSPFEALLRNSVVALAVSLASMYIWLLLNSHRDTLLATVHEYCALLDRWRQKLSFEEQQAEVDATRETLDERKTRLLAYFSVTRWTIIATVAITLGLFLTRVFQWEDAIWQALRG